MQTTQELPSVVLPRKGSIYDPYQSSFLQRTKLLHSLSLAPDQKPEQGLSVNGAALAYISTIIGSGIVALPYAMQEAGWALGMAIHLGMIVVLLMAVYLNLKAKDILGYE